MVSNIKWSLIEVKASEIKRNPNNPKIRNDKGFKRLQKSLEKFGKVFDGIVNKDMTLIDGHSRHELSRPDEILRVFIPSKQLSKKEYLEMNAIFDLAKAGDIDEQILESQFTEDFFEEWELRDKKVEAVEDDYEIPNEIETEIVLGDLFEIGEHRLLCGDSTDAEQVNKLMNGEKIDMIFTDPPYGINEKGDRSKRGGLAKGNNLPDFIDDSVIYAEKAFNHKHNNLIPIQVWFGANYYCHTLPQSNNWLVWDKRVEDKQKDTQSDCELAWVKSRFNSVRIFRHLWKGMMKESERGQRRVHATQKPVALISFCQKEYGLKEGGLILDYFSGSGSTMVSAHQLKRRCYGMELDPKYCQVILDRMRKLDPSLEVKKNGNPI